MCGIFGHVGSINSFSKCLKGLSFLEYRGYDSAGIAGVQDDLLICFKEKGNLSELEKTLENKLIACQTAIGHMRWATHGKASRLNAHPHLDQNRDLAIVHNGILENHRSLRTMLEENGVVFETDTDSEVIAQLIAYLFDGDLIRAINEALKLMRGFWAIALIHKKYPDQIIAFTREVPLVVGFSQTTNEAFVSSDVRAFNENAIDLYFLKNDEIACVSKQGVRLFDGAANPIYKDPEHFEVEEELVDKGFYEHFMLKEIFEQPQAIRNALDNRFNFETGKVDFEQFSLSNEEIKEFKRILFLGCGTSWHAACIAAQQFEELTGIPCCAEISSEYRYKNSRVDAKTLVIAISQSGETIETLIAARKTQAQGAKVLAICNVAASSLMREADYGILLRAGPEVSVCSTKAFTCQITLLSLLAHKFADLDRDLLKQLIDLPEIVEHVLSKTEEIALLAKKYASYNQFFFIGRQYMHFTGLEAALKLKEISYVNAYGHAAGELKHGPIALLDSQSVVIGLCGNSLTYEKMLSNLMEVKAREAHVIAFVPYHAEEIEEIADDLLYLPPMSDLIASIPYSVAAQLFAYFIALARGTEIDQPRNLAKSVTIE